ncbi:MAG: DUF4115 domain-containing protein [Candidatus Omnitrophota bacterium]|nr:DUF4115 domain-containing protein [Candidatus Omnitrophota bacterium]
MTTPKDIGKIFSEEREKQKLSLEKAAGQSRIHSDVIRDIENGVFNRLGKLYVKSFMKKYAEFLGLDTQDIIRQYEDVSSRMPGREFSLQEEKEQKDETIAALSDEKLQKAFVAVLSVVLVVLIFVLIGMMRSRMSPVSPQKSVTTVKEKKPAVRVKEVTSPDREEKTSRRAAASGTRKEAPLTLILEARGKAWVKVSRGKKKLFAGILKKGGSKTWRSDGTLTVWTGKADMLDFTVNERKIGVVAAGVVKNIVVSSRGVKIGDVWVARLE